MCIRDRSLGGPESAASASAVSGIWVGGPSDTHARPGEHLGYCSTRQAGCHVGRDAGTPRSAMMATVRVRRRAACSSALVGLLGVLAAGAAWLGIAQAPTSGAVLWGTFVADTTAAGTLAFLTTSGRSADGAVTRGLVDFPAQDEIARTMLGKPSSHLRIELKVVNGTAYQRGLRNGIELGRWRRLPTPVGLVPFTGVALPLLTASPAHLKRLGQIDLRGTMTVSYTHLDVYKRQPPASAIVASGQGRSHFAAPVDRRSRSRP